ncbi:MAG: glycoside hydrolase, partial [Anaerolineae bacterium]|nr:glycoside hydrolase [Anaerolineae bacterium]
MSLFYRPHDGWLADVIPFYWEGEYHLFYLKDYRSEATHGLGTPWWHLATRDFVHFEDYGEALPRGTKDEQDLYVFTGSVIEKDGQFHIYYTGHNPIFRKNGKPEQAIMHATSPDLMRWTKDPANPISFADPQYYEVHDWRDPFVFWNETAREYWMLLAARHNTGPINRRGCTALLASKDLVAWECREPFWSPGLYFTHE